MPDVDHERSAKYVEQLRLCRTPLTPEGRYRVYVSTDLAGIYEHPMLEVVIDPKLPKRGDPPPVRREIEGAKMAEFTVRRRP